MGKEQRAGDQSWSGLPHVMIYTDGAAEPNPGKGGYGVVLIHPKNRKELSCGFELTTNNRMELLGVIEGLKVLKRRCRVTIYSDSKYVVEAIAKGWILRWQSKGWFRTQFERAKNWDLWERYLEIAAKHEVKLEWIKGHDGHEHNERCDALAVAAANGTDLQIDHGYLLSLKQTKPNDSVGATEGVSTQSEQISSGTHKRSSKKSIITHKEPGEPCRDCGTALEKRDRKKQTVKANQDYYFKWYLYCPGCKSKFMVEETKVFVERNQKSIFDGQEHMIDHD